MKSPKNFLLVLFALSTLGIGALAWQQYQELIKLRAEVMNGEDRASMQKRLAAAEKRVRDLESQLAALQGQGGDDAETMAAAAANGTGDANGNRAGRGNRNQGNFAAIRALMDKPEVQALMAVQQKAALANRYAALFKSLGLSPDQADKVMGLLAQKQTALQDVMAAAREQGINPRTDPSGFNQLVTAAQSDVNNSLKATLGDAGFSQLQQYDQTMPQRSVVNQLQQSLSYTSSPLSDAQTDQLIQILAANAAQRQNGAVADGGGFGGGGFRATLGGGGGPGGGGFGGGGATITSNALIQAQTVLSTTQFQALQQLQQTQQAQQQMQQLIRQAVGGGQGGNGTTRAKGGG